MTSPRRNKGALFLILAMGVLGGAQAGDVESGRRLYEQGLNAQGEPVAARTQGDIVVSGSQFKCAGCHRRSGYGSSEGGVFVPPVTAGFLFEPRKGDRAFLFRRLFQESQPRRFWARVREPHARPAYTRETLASAIREGVTPGGQVLDPVMPRYALSDQDMDNLTVYLRQLSASSDPGVDGETIHLATVVSDGVDPSRKAAMLETVRAFEQWMNLDTQGDLRNPYFSPGYRTDLIAGYRYWKVNVWELHGDVGTWRSQLEDHYRGQPVFAVVSGLVEGPWDPVHRFCESNAVPCLFPNTDLPDTRDPAYASVYLHRGLELEAEALAQYLHDTLEDGTPVIQLAAGSWEGQRPAESFRRRFRVMGGGLAQDSTLEPGTTGGQIQVLVSNVSVPSVWVIWPGKGDTQTVIDGLAHRDEVVKAVYLPSTTLERLPKEPAGSLDDRLYLTFPYELPSAYHPRAFRVRAWMRTRGLDIDHWRLRFNTYYTLTILQFGLNHIVDKFSRDYLLEYVEHEAENALNPGTYPRLSLGPGQRFASKGVYIVKPGNDAKAPVVGISDWIVP